MYLENLSESGPAWPVAPHSRVAYGFPEYAKCVTRFRFTNYDYTTAGSYIAAVSFPGFGVASCSVTSSCATLAHDSFLTQYPALKRDLRGAGVLEALPVVQIAKARCFVVEVDRLVGGVGLPLAPVFLQQVKDAQKIFTLLLVIGPHLQHQFTLGAGTGQPSPADFNEVWRNV